MPPLSSTPDNLARAETAPRALWRVRVYYEDTDAGGVVYYANYLKFAERARTEWLRDLGATHAHLLAEHNALFVVRRAAVEYLAPARLDDLIEIGTEVVGCGAATLDMRQILRHEGKLLAVVDVSLAAISPAGKVLRLPTALIKAFRACMVSKTEASKTEGL